ncbi:MULTISPECIES: hypothetical protein [Rhodomicrobium]|uniref:hypothetical protein n=1 Tax=Rhodomicrobium TaxID=1068 RepID=UPI000F73BE38|nr:MULTISPECIES: hypothetical protein [Rhodomicrobium]
MGHQISALIARAPIDAEAARQFDLPVIIENDFAIVGLDATHSDHWSKELGLENTELSEMVLDRPVTHEFARRLGMERYALIETDYFGGAGEQCAAVYCGLTIAMPATPDGINAALKLLGVKRKSDVDEFDTIGLGRHRSFDDQFEKYARF